MILKELKIHNIASIENAAIDFIAEPLKNSDVFLITGKTGSGKTTILDAICLALYKKVPRMTNSNRDARIDDIQIDDVRQLMRRNTAEASVELSFTGNDNIDYIATWSVWRSHKRMNGNLQDVVWNLKDETNGTVYTKVGDIQGIINQAVGLDYNQFCRTTMLAQGEFTRFLKSNDQEKADILEKITGTDIYTKIGKQIFDITSEKKKDWEKATERVNGTTTLSDEEILDRQEQIAGLDADLKQKTDLQRAEEKKYDWLKKNKELSASVEKATVDYNTAVNAVNDKEFIQKKDTVTKWNSTIEVRNKITNRNNAVANNERNYSTISCLRNDYLKCLNGAEYLKQQRSSKIEELNVVDALIQRDNSKVSVYENSQTICSKLEQIGGERNTIALQENNRLEAENMIANRHNPDKEKINRSLENLQNNISKLTDILKGKTDEREKIDLETLNKDSASGITLVNNIKNAVKSIENWNTAKVNRAAKETELKKLSEKIEKDKETLAEKAYLVKELDTLRSEAEAVYNKSIDSVNKFATEIRSRLNVGDVCPVCRRVVMDALPDERELEENCNKLKKILEDYNARYNTAKQEWDKINGSVTADERFYNKSLAEFNKDTSVNDSYNQALEQCKACGLNDVTESSVTELNVLKDQTEERNKTLGSTISRATDLDKEIASSRKEIDNANRDIERLNKRLTEINDAITACNGKISTAETIISNSKSNIENLENSLAELITVNWDIDWRTDSEQFCSSLKSATEIYNSYLQKRDTLSNELKLMKSDLETIDSLLNAILNSMPVWNKFSATGAVKLTDIINSLNRLTAELGTTNGSVRENEEIINSCNSAIVDFINQHGEYTVELLNSLNGISQVTINSMSKDIADCESKVTACRAALDTLSGQYKEHNEQKPGFVAEDTESSLEKAIKIIQQECHAINQKIGAINQELKTDQDNKKEKAELLKQVETCKKEYDMWNNLNKFIGSSKGDTFKQIAQSYVLSSLIHAANIYLELLTDRYRLQVVPGTFIILVEDAYQGYVTRPASTISGGESFLVSLSLALALSDFGGKLKVNTLFIDEGFGTLSGEPLQNAINTLRQLKIKTGRNVGIISHVEEIKERIPVQIRVNPKQNKSCSDIEIIG